MNERLFRRSIDLQLLKYRVQLQVVSVQIQLSVQVQVQSNQSHSQEQRHWHLKTTGLRKPLSPTVLWQQHAQQATDSRLATLVLRRYASPGIIPFLFLNTHSPNISSSATELLQKQIDHKRNIRQLTKENNHDPIPCFVVLFSVDWDVMGDQRNLFPSPAPVSHNCATFFSSAWQYRPVKQRHHHPQPGLLF